jgi:hypothetical protein
MGIEAFSRPWRGLREARVALVLRPRAARQRLIEKFDENPRPVPANCDGRPAARLTGCLLDVLDI